MNRLESQTSKRTCRVTLARVVKNSVTSGCVRSLLYFEPMRHSVSNTTLDSPLKKSQRSSSNNKPWVSGHMNGLTFSVSDGVLPTGSQK